MITMKDDVYEEVEGTSERYGCDSKYFCTGRGSEGLGGTVLSLSYIGEGHECKKKSSNNPWLGGLLGGAVVTTDEDATGGSGSDVNAPNSEKVHFAMALEKVSGSMLRRE